MVAVCFMDDLETLLRTLADMAQYVELKLHENRFTCIARVNEHPPEFLRHTKDCPIEATQEVLLEICGLDAA